MRQPGIAEFKRLFFRPESITNPLEKAKRKRFSQFGYFVMRDARQSIKRPGKRVKNSRPGSPPRNQTGKLKFNIYFGWDDQARSVVAGPAKLSGNIKSIGLARILEEGGDIRVIEQERKGRKIIRKYGKRIKIEARPYMKPAFDNQKAKQLPQLLRDSI